MTFCCNLKREALTTRCDSNCVLADTTSWRGDRQLSEAIRGRDRQWQLLFLHHTFQWKKGAGRLIHSVWVMGHPTAIVTAVKDFSSTSVYFIKYFSSLNQQTASVLSFSAAMCQVCHRVKCFGSWHHSWCYWSWVHEVSSGDSKSAKYKQWHLCACFPVVLLFSLLDLFLLSSPCLY